MIWPIIKPGDDNVKEIVYFIKIFELVYLLILTVSLLIYCRQAGWKKQSF